MVSDETMIIVTAIYSATFLVILAILLGVWRRSIVTDDGKLVRKEPARWAGGSKKKKYAPKLHDDATMAQIEERLNEAARSAQPRGMGRR